MIAKSILLLLCASCLWFPAAVPAAEQNQSTRESPAFAWKRFEINGRPAFVILPEESARKPKPKTPWVLYAPTFGKSLPNRRDEGWMMERFLAKGIAIAGVDVGESYGSPKGRATYTALFDEVVKKYGFDSKACLLARSRGGLMLYAWAADNPEKVRCIAGIYPVCDLRSYPGLKKACGAYGMNEAELAAKLDDHNPVERLAPLAKAGVPIFHIHGDIDKVVPIDANSGLVAKRYQKLGGRMELRVARGQWHNMWRGFFECQDLVDFVVSEATGSPRVDPEPELLWAKGEFTEGPAIAPDGSLLFSDVGANAIYRFSPGDGSVTLFRKSSGRANGLMFDGKGRLVACEGANTGGGRRISVTEPNGDVRTLAENWNGKRFNSPNDLVSDATGNVYFSDPRYVGDEPREIDFEGVFLVKPDGEVILATRDVRKPNGLQISADGKTMFVADHEGAADGVRHLLSFSIQRDGTLAEKKVLHDFGKSRGIDGMTIGADGNLYCTAGSGTEAGIYVFDPAGRLLRVIHLPGDPTNCVFGSGTESGTLYVTAQAPAGESANGGRPFGLYRIRMEKNDQEGPLPDPIAHWPLDDAGEMARDAAGTHHGKIVGATSTGGRVGKALLFDRPKAQHVSIPYSEAFKISTFTVAAWVHLTRPPTFSGILGTRFGGSDHTFDMKVNDAKVHGDIGDGKKWIETKVNFYADDKGSNQQGGDLKLGTWYHIVFVIDSETSECRLYLDADLKKVISFKGKGTPRLMQPGQEMRIGNSSSDEFMDGVIDDVRIWDQALSAGQVKQVFQRHDEN